MSNISKTNAWASLAACLAIAFAAASAVAQEQQSDQSQSNQDQQQSSEDQSQQARQSNEPSSDQASQDEQSRRSDQQRAQQQRQRDRQSQQRNQQQARQQSESSWSDQSSRDESSWPSPNRYESDRDGRQSSREQQGGLGINIASDDREGVVIRLVHRGSPAEEMGLRPNDRITHLNGRVVQSVRDFISRIRNIDPGEEVELDIRRARGGAEQTVRGELESRNQALAERGQQSDRYQQGREFGQQSDRYGQMGRGDDSQQTSYEEEDRSSYGGERSGQMSSARIEQLERQVERLSQQIDDLRAALQDVRRQGREQTARYDEFESRTIQSPRRSATRWDDSNRYRQSDRSRGGQLRRSEERRSSDGQRTQRSSQSNSDTGSSQPSSDSGAPTIESRRIDPDQGNRSDTGRSNDAEPETPGGEIGEDRQSVGAEDARE